jgi:Fur family transcriptional regulator, ferric uptake regulator
VSGSVHAIAAARLAAGGSRYTQSRQALVELLGSAGCPLTAEEIVARCGRHRGSVYRNLGVLAGSGVVQAIAGHAEFTRYELDEALIGHHHHLACTTCGALTDFALPPDLESQLENAVAAIAKRDRFGASGHRLDVVGLCRDCRTP